LPEIRGNDFGLLGGVDADGLWWLFQGSGFPPSHAPSRRCLNRSRHLPCHDPR
jgi:hypothetical protein